MAARTDARAEHQEAGGALVDVSCHVVGCLSPALEGLSGACICTLKLLVFSQQACGARNSGAAI